MDSILDDNGDNQVMVVDMATPRVTIGIVVVSTIILAISLLIGGVGPETVLTHNMWSYECPKGEKSYDPINCYGVCMCNNGTPWVGTIEGLNSRNQFWSLSASIQSSGGQYAGQYNFPAIVNITGRSANTNGWVEVIANEEHKVTVTCEKGQEMCDPVLIAFDEYLVYEDYRAEILFSVPDGGKWMQNTQFTFGTVDPDFTSLVLGTTITYFIATVVLLVLFVRRLGGCKGATPVWAYEQKWAAVILVSCALFDNPFLPIQYATHGWFFAALQAIFQIFHGCAMAMFILVNFDRYRTRRIDPSDYKMFYGPKFLAVGTLFVLGAALGMTFSLADDVDPITLGKGNDSFVRFLVVVMVLNLLLVVYQIVVIVAAGVAVYKKHRELTVRYTYLLVPTVVVVVCMFVGFATGSLGPFPRNSAGFMFFITLRNLFVWVIAVLYWPIDAEGFKLVGGVGGGSGAGARESESIVAGTNPRYASTENPFV